MGEFKNNGLSTWAGLVRSMRSERFHLFINPVHYAIVRKIVSFFVDFLFFVLLAQCGGRLGINHFLAE